MLACGRRFGKTTLGQDRLFRPALEGAAVAWCGPGYRSMLDTWEALRAMLFPVTVRVREAEHRLEVINRGVIQLWSLEEPDLLRGGAYARVIIDEAATVKHLRYAWEEVLRPTLTDQQGDAWFLSTPRGLNYFHTLYRKGEDPAETEWAAWRFPTSDNPYIVPAEIEAARNDLPERAYAQEYEAEFLETEGQVFRRVLEAVREPIAAPVGNGPPQYVVGVDWARVRDYTVYVALDVTRKHVVDIDRFRQINYETQLGRLRAFAEKYPPVRVIAERNAMGDPLVEQLRRQGFPVWPYLTTSVSKSAAIESLALAFEQNAITIPDNRILIGELLAYQAEKLPSGLLRYEAPAGGHDDCVMALALAWQAVAHAPHSAAEARRLYGW